MIDILMVDDSQIHLEGLKLILGNEPQIRLAGEAHSVKETLLLLEQSVPSIVLLDIGLEEDMDGIKLAGSIKKDYPEVKIIILSHYKTINLIIGALQAGVNAYLAKDCTPDELLHCIISVDGGKGVYLGETLPMAELTRAFGSKHNLQQNKPFKLSKREIEIIDLLAQNLSTQQIGDQLHISRSTVESHKENIKEKLQLNTVLEIVLFAIKKKIIHIDR